MADINTCIRKVRKTVHLTLPACYISNEIVGIKDIFSSWKKQYVDQLAGILVNYNDVSFQSKYGIVQGNRPQVHFDVTATFELFCPTVGEKTYGKICRISKHHVGCLIEENINASIYLNNNVYANFNKSLFIGQIIVFKITQFDFYRNVIRVNGEVNEDCIALTAKMFPVKTNHVYYNDSQATVDLSALNDSRPKNSSSKSKMDNEFLNNTESYSELSKNGVECVKNEVQSSQSESENNEKKKRKSSHSKLKKKYRTKSFSSDSLSSSTDSVGQEYHNGDSNVDHRETTVIKDTIKREVSSSQSESEEKERKRKRESTERTECHSKKKKHKTKHSKNEFFDFDNNSDILSSIKQEIMSPVKDMSETQEHDSSAFEAINSHKKKKKHKKKDKKKFESSHKSDQKTSKKRKTIIPAGDVFKKSKKSKKSSKDKDRKKFKEKFQA